eukprot:c3811_g1_i1.p2 GENE.c3811_g1_i1~~c3811_g1_i1.p2  ORF type:complete len:100 (+),score=9.32 c3811_g1_i1:39-338(+)
MSGIAVGLKKGHVVQKIKPKNPAPVSGKGKLNKRRNACREVVREVVGFAPYEKRLLELLKIGKDKKTLKLAKARLGTHLRGKRKREEMSAVLRAQRSKK